MSHHEASQSPAASNAVFLVIAAALALVAGGTVIWGLPVLAMSALFMVPVIFTLLMMVTRG